MVNELLKLEERARQCTACPLHTGRRHVVFGEGDPQSDLMLIGEAPGKTEDEQGRPFVGRAGHILNEAFCELGMKREKIYITNITKCRPPGNRKPRKKEIEPCVSLYLKKQIEYVSPRLVVTLGAVPSQTLVSKAPISEVHGKICEKGGLLYMPTFHPAAILYDRTLYSLFLEDMAQL